MPQRCCCCPPSGLADCGEIGTDYPVGIDVPDIRTPVWKSDDPLFVVPALENIAENVTINSASLVRTNVASEGHPAEYLYDIQLESQPDSRWAAISQVWTGVTVCHTSRVDDIPGQKSYTGPRYGVEIKSNGIGDLNNVPRGTSPHLPLFGFGLCLRTSGRDVVYSSPWWPGYSDGLNNVPRCWAAHSELPATMVPYEPGYDGSRVNVYPFGLFGTEAQGTFPNLTWERREVGPFNWGINWPPDDADWELGWYFILHTEPIDPLLGDYPPPPEQTEWHLSVRMRSLCLQEQVRPRCSAAFASTTELTISVPDLPGAVPIEPSSWRGLEWSLTPDEIPELTDVNDPRWLQSLHYWQRAFVGSTQDLVGNTISVSYVPCVSLAITITPADNSCPIKILIDHLGDCLDEGMVFGIATGLPDSEHGPDLPSYACLNGAGVNSRYEPERAAISYDPIALAYRVRFVNGPQGPFSGGPCDSLPDPCNPTDRERCGFTLLKRAVGNYSYEGLSIANVFRPEAAWLWFELRDAS